MTNQKTPERLEVCWRVLEASSTRILVCSVYDTATQGYELRVGYRGHLPLHSETVSDIESARALAQRWLDGVRAASRQ